MLLLLLQKKYSRSNYSHYAPCPFSVFLLPNLHCLPPYQADARGEGYSPPHVSCVYPRARVSVRACLRASVCIFPSYLQQVPRKPITATASLLHRRGSTCLGLYACIVCLCQYRLVCAVLVDVGHGQKWVTESQVTDEHWASPQCPLRMALHRLVVC